MSDQPRALPLKRFLLIELPCFNVSLNPQPTPLPPTYLPPNAKLRRRRSLKQLVREAERAVKAADNQIW